MRIFLLALLASLCIHPSAKAQLLLTDGRNTLEISGGLYTYYNYRFYPEKATDQKKNNFAVRNAYIDFEGRIGKNIEYDLKYNFAKVGQDDAENPPLMSANMLYKGLKVVDIRVGYGKLMYGRSSIVAFQYSPFIQRSVFGKGDIYSRRDAGVNLEKTLFNQRINLYAGAYTGLGEAFNSLAGDNDPSGNPEFVGRVDYSYPCRYRYREIDNIHVPIPMVSVGINGRYADKRREFVGDYSMKTINGKKRAVGADISFQYKGFSAQAEVHSISVTPRLRNSLSYTNADPKTGVATTQNWAPTEDHYTAGGYMVQANYHSKVLKSVFSVRYDNFNANNLRKFDTSENINFAYNYMVDGFNSVIKVQYFYRLTKDAVNGPADDQIRIGWQLLFK